MYVDVVVTRRNLEAVTIGTLVGKVGAPPVLRQEHSNFFMHPMDQWYCDSATGKPVYEGQKPVSLIKELMELYTTPKDWIFSSPTDIGMYTYICMYIICKSAQMDCL